MIKKISFIASLLLVLVLPGCYFDNEQELYPYNNNCDTTAITYSITITPIIQHNCNTCHGSSTAVVSGAGIDLEGHANLSGYITAHQTLFLNAIQHTGSAVPMPLGGGSLSSCNLTHIKMWIDAGMPNN
jgi:hypothetical protein